MNINWVAKHCVICGGVVMGAGGDEDTKLNKTVSSRTSQSIEKIGIYNIF